MAGAGLAYPLALLSIEPTAKPPPSRPVGSGHGGFLLRWITVQKHSLNTRKSLPESETEVQLPAP